MLELTIRLVVSLAIVVGLLLVLARFGSRKFRGGAGALVQVVHRQPLSRTSSVAVVTVGGRVLVLGTTEQQVSVLAEMDPDELDLPVEDIAPVEGEELLTVPDALTTPPVSRRTLRSPQSRNAAPAPTDRAPTGDAGKHRAAGATIVGSPTSGPLAGSVLSARTWKQAYRSVTALGAVKPPGRRAS